MRKQAEHGRGQQLTPGSLPPCPTRHRRRHLPPPPLPTVSGSAQGVGREQRQVATRVQCADVWVCARVIGRGCGPRAAVPVPPFHPAIRGTSEGRCRSAATHSTTGRNTREPCQHMENKTEQGFEGAQTLGTYSATSTSGLKVRRGVLVFFPWLLEPECGKSAACLAAAGDRC